MPWAAPCGVAAGQATNIPREAEQLEPNNHNDCDDATVAAEEHDGGGDGDGQLEGHVAASGEDGLAAVVAGAEAVEASNCWPGDPAWNARCASGALDGNRLHLRQTPLSWQVAVVQSEGPWRSWDTTLPSGSAVVVAAAGPFERQPQRPSCRLPARLLHSPRNYLECSRVGAEYAYLYLGAGEQVPYGCVVGLGQAHVARVEGRILCLSDIRAWEEFSIVRPELLVCWRNHPGIQELLDCG